MKKILIMALCGFAFCSAEAQAQTKEVCRISKSKASCYRTKYSENFKVCKNSTQYYICGEIPTYANSTKRTQNVAMQDRDMQYAQNTNQSMPEAASNDVIVAPQSQSYPVASSFNVSSASAYEGYYPKRHYMQVTYSESAAEETRAPYEGLPSPQDDGPAKDAERNINANNPNAHLAPLTGRSE